MKNNELVSNKEIGIAILNSMKITDCDSDGESMLYINVEVNSENIKKIMFLVWLAGKESELPDFHTFWTHYTGTVDDICQVDITPICWEFSDWYEDGFYSQKPEED